MSGSSRDGDDSARGNRHTVGKCERAQHETDRGNWEEAESGSVSRNSRGRSNERMEKPLSRWLSRRKLSILYILSTPAFVQPSSSIAATASSRRGSRYSGLA